MKPHSRSFAQLLTAFAAAVVANDGAGLGMLFTPDGVCDDGFFGAHRGRAAIAQMLQRFHDTGGDYRWEWNDPISDGVTGYASASAIARGCPSVRERRSASTASAGSASPRTG